MFLRFNGYAWCNQEGVLQRPNRHWIPLTDAKISNIPLASLRCIASVDEEVAHIFTYAPTTLSPRFVNKQFVWMSKYEDLMVPFVMGSHSRLGSASLVHALSGHPEILQMIGDNLA
jgi:hypothetical protein